jgi:hypothetical protein
MSAERCTSPPSATNVLSLPPWSVDAATILEGSWPGHGSLDALWSCAKHSRLSSPSSATRSAARGTLKAPDLSNGPTAVLSYSPLLFLHLTAT